MVSQSFSEGKTFVRSTSEFVYNTILEAILTNQLPGGVRLVEAKTSKDLNVSITPVREAFARLANQGLLTVFPYKGTYVTIVTKEYVEDVSYLRKHLEMMAVERGFSKLKEEDILYFEKLCIASDQAYDQGNLSEAIRFDVLFHEHMFRVSGSSLLMEMWNTIKYRIENIQSYTKPAMNPRISIRHKPMLDALYLRDESKFAMALMEHLNSNISGVDFPNEKDIQYD
ncbi:MAG: GntR family transcriptional regulator [Lawsonibacter sp.]|jgi:DNA-binding GntR family transcriptional regulator